MARRMTSGELARLIYDSYPGSDVLPLDPDTDCASMDTLRETVSQDNFGDGLFRFIVVEIYETSLDGGVIDLDQAEHAVDTAVQDMDAVRQAISQAA